MAAIADENVPLGTNMKADAPPKAKKAGGHKVLKHREHVLLRPDTYVGATELQEADMWVYNSSLEKMEFRKVTYAPALYKIFDEIIVNSADHKQRDDTMKQLKVTIDQEAGSVSVWNDGNGIPIQESDAVDEKTGKNLWVPEMIFGVLLSGSNYNDDEERLGGGRNGYGAKLTNIFSKKFTLETCYVNPDTSETQTYKQTWTDNMEKKGKPTIKTVKKAKGGWTKITFEPDFEKFHMPNGLDDDIVALMKRRAFDMAGSTPKDVKVSLDGDIISVKDFQSYCNLYMPKDEEIELGAATKKTILFEAVNERWEIGVTESQDEESQQISFVNSIATTQGGTHIRMLQRILADHLETFIKKKHKKDVKASQIKKSLWIFAKCLIVNPAFGSQTKEELKTKESEFEGKLKKKATKEFECNFSDKFLKKLQKSEIVAAILTSASNKEARQAARVGGKKTAKVKIPKLEDANNAGRGKAAAKCTLILTEGDSAKSLAMAGLSVVGRDNYGVFPLKGKLLNVRDASHAQFMNNKEIQNIMKIMGLTVGKKYEDVSKLRYGHLMIMTDQDHDGSHIKGLIINFIHKYWPSLLKLPDFLQVFVTPIIKAKKGDKKSKQHKEQIFYTLPEYETWKSSLPDQGKSWDIKYYKGLGTSTSGEAKEYFKGLKKNKLEMLWTDENENNLIDMCFSNKRADDRKDWIMNTDSGCSANFNQESMSITEFIKKELVLFSIADNHRSLPSVVDGFKNSQRKVLFACFKRNLVKEIRVAQLAGYISEHAMYHHGETSLCGTIVGMAQTHVGSNNINLLVPSGQFGSRLQGGKDAASPRYIHTMLMDMARLIFHPDDDSLLNYLNDDGVSIEPDYYSPIIPMLLVNGASGIGTGWSCKVPNFNPRDLIDNLKRMIDVKTPTISHIAPLEPWYQGFTGTIERQFHKKKGFEGRFTVRGCAEWLDDRTFRVTELPIGTWTENYKHFLNDEKNFKDGEIDDLKEHHTDTTVDFEITLGVALAEKLRHNPEDLFKKFNLQETINVTNMTCFDANQKIRTFQSPEEILLEFYYARLDMYTARKALILDRLKKEYTLLDNKCRFILAVINGEIVVSNRPKKDLMKDLRMKGYAPMPHQAKGKKKDDDDIFLDDSAKDYDYLLSMPLWNLTLEKVEKLKEQKMKKQDELYDLESTEVTEIWIKDLDQLSSALDVFDDEMKEGMKRKTTANSVVGEKIVVQANVGGVYNPGISKSAESTPVIETVVDDVPMSESVAQTSLGKLSTESLSATVSLSDDDAAFEAPPAKISKVAKKTKTTKAKKVATKKKKASPKRKERSSSSPSPIKPDPSAASNAAAAFLSALSDSDDEFGGGLLARLQARKRNGKKPAPKYVFSDDSSQEDDLDSSIGLSSTMSKISVTKKSSCNGSGNAKKKAKTAVVKKKSAPASESEDSDSWSPSDGGDDDDDSDFEL